jgi:hypothetical protein
MTTIRVLSILGVLCACSNAQAASIITVVNNDTRTVTTTTERGTAVTEVTRSGNTVTARTTFQPKSGYQPMGGGSYKPMGGSGYKPMGR